MEAKGHAGATAAWNALEHGLAEALAVMGDRGGQFLILTDDRSSRYVQFAVKSGAELHAEAVSNHYLTRSDALSGAEMAGMEELGWSPPTGTPAETAKQGCANYFKKFQRPIDFRAVSKLAVSTLRHVFQVPYPARLGYDAFDEAGDSILIPTLEIAPRKAPRAKASGGTAVETEASLRAKVLETIRRASGNPDLAFDEDLELAMRFDTALVFARVAGEPPYVSIYSPVLANIEGKERVLERINELNTKVRFARLFETGGTIYAAVEVFGSPFAEEHVASACKILGGLADQIDELLQAEFGGRTAFGQFRSKPELTDGRAASADAAEGGEKASAPRSIGFVAP